MPTDPVTTVPSSGTQAITLPSQREVQARYETAKAAGVSPCAWIPPEWASIKISGGRGTLPNNSSDDEGFQNPDASEEARERIRQGHAHGAPNNPELPAQAGTWANPFSDFTHVDESEYPAADLGAVAQELEGPWLQEVGNVDAGLRDRISVFLRGPSRDLVRRMSKALRGRNAGLRHKVKKALQERDPNLAKLEKEVHAEVTDTGLRDEIIAALRNAPPERAKLETEVDTILHANPTLRDKVKLSLKGEDPVGRLKRIVGGGSPGMKRLALIFEWALHRATVLLGDLNDALAKGNAGEADYTLARTLYLKFLKDLDDHEPEKNGQRRLDVKDKTSASGYGRSLKWACIDPVIFDGRIVGARVIIHWNPHSSSNGIPVQHP
jgi:hypothetical protein